MRKETFVLRASSGFAFVPRLIKFVAALASCFVFGLSESAVVSAQGLGSPPAVGTGGVDVTGATTAIVVGVANPEGQSTTIHADYALADELWCASDGEEGTPSETIPENLGSSNTIESEIPVKLEDLIPAREYCVELVATNASGTAYGHQIRFTTDSAQGSGSPPTTNGGVLEWPPLIAPLTTVPPVETNAPAAPKSGLLTKAQKRLINALRACKSKPRKQRAACYREARKKYGIAARKAAKQANKGKR
jgi:hypothetical protein